jgi:hypothetical protein
LRELLDFELLGQEGGIDAGEGRRIFVANLLDRVEALEPPESFGS